MDLCDRFVNKKIVEPAVDLFIILEFIPCHHRRHYLCTSKFITKVLTFYHVTQKLLNQFSFG